ncbi:MAG TPA: VWA domain-containing protein [Candidatus Limnocylindrales bacterium]|nr:VWA domain-containing protein [Candidatus Limnocylindrales bacterium]
MTLQWPWGLLAVLLVPVGLLAARRIEERRRARVAALGAFARPREETSARPATRVLDRVAAGLVVAAFVLLAVGLARPQATVSLPRIEGTLVLTFDVSASMLADDVAPSRMEVAKTAAKAIVDAQPVGVVIGVAAFSDGGLSIQVPTADQVPVRAAIDRLAPSRGTSIGQGINAALAAIEKAESDTPADYYSNRSAAPTPVPAPVRPGSHDEAAIVLISDGENNERPDPLGAARAAADLGIRILTVGVGTADGTTLDLDGFRVQTALDENMLREVADLTAGSYQPAAELDVPAIYRQLATHLVARETNVELTGLVAAMGLVLLLVGVGLTLGRAGRLP